MHFFPKGMQFKDLYSKQGREVKGKGIDLGHQRNWVFLGLTVALKEDTDTTSSQKDQLEDIVLKRTRDDQSRIDPAKAKSLAGLTAYCQVVRLAKMAYVNILERGEDGKKVYQLLAEGLTREGELTYEGPPPKPIHKEIKQALEAMYKARGRR